MIATVRHSASNVASNCVFDLITMMIYGPFHAMGRRLRNSNGKGRLLVRRLSVAAVMLMVGIGVAGPSGLIAWSDNLRLLDERQAQLALLETDRAALENKVALLDPNNADPDMVGELLRSQLNVVHPDEVVVKLDD